MLNVCKYIFWDGSAQTTTKVRYVLNQFIKTISWLFGGFLVASCFSDFIHSRLLYALKHTYLRTHWPINWNLAFFNLSYCTKSNIAQTSLTGIDIMIGLILQNIVEYS